MSQTPNCLQHTFSKGPSAANTRSSMTCSCMSKSSPTVPPDPISQSAQPPSQSPKHSPHCPSSVQPIPTYQSHSFKLSTVNRLEESINHMTTVLTKLVSKDEDNQTSSSQVKPNSQSQRHSHQPHVNVTSTQEPHTVSSDKDLSFETKSISENKYMPTQIPSQAKPSYKTVLETNPVHTPKSNTLLPINTVSNNPVPHSNMNNPSHSHKTNSSHTHFHKPQPQAFQPFQTPSTPKLPTIGAANYSLMVFCKGALKYSCLLFGQ
jgi:hypothetical protein